MREDVHSSVSWRTVAGEVGLMAKSGVKEGATERSHQAEGSWGPLQWTLSRLTATPRVDSCPCVFVVLPRSFPAPHPTCSLHSSPSARPFPAHLSCFHGHRFILHSSSHPRYRKLLFSLFMDPLLPSTVGEALQEDGGPALGEGHPCHILGAQLGSSPRAAACWHV